MQVGILFQNKVVDANPVRASDLVPIAMYGVSKFAQGRYTMAPPRTPTFSVLFPKTGLGAQATVKELVGSGYTVKEFVQPGGTWVLTKRLGQSGLEDARWVVDPRVGGPNFQARAASAAGKGVEPPPVHQ